MSKVEKKIIKHNGKNISISGYKSDHIYRSIVRRNDFYEKTMLYAISKHLSKRPIGAIIDGGANIGNHSLFFAMFCPCTKVIAYEPYEPTLEILKKNVADNNLDKRIDVRPLGLYKDFSGLEVSYFVERNFGATEFVESNNTNATKAVPLDADCAGERISCIKLDIQGLEPEALMGSEKILKEQFPLLVIEAMTKDEYIYLKKYLGKFDYKVYPASKAREHYNSSATYIFGK